MSVSYQCHISVSVSVTSVFVCGDLDDVVLYKVKE